MPDLNPLSPYTQCYAAVGKFFFTWALMEHALKSAIEKAIGLEGIQGAIVTSNIQFRDKIHILRTAVDGSPISPESEKKRYDTMLNDIANYSQNRNMMAHDPFGPSEDGNGVKFIVVKAKGKLKIPPTVWSFDDFVAAYDKIDNYRKELEALTKKLKRASVLQQIATGKFPLPSGGLLGPDS